MPLEKRHFEVWEGVNIQEFTIEPPKPNETRLALYLVDVAKGLSKEFRHANNAIKELVQRKISYIAYGSKGENVVFKVVIKWEEESV